MDNRYLWYENCCHPWVYWVLSESPEKGLECRDVEEKEHRTSRAQISTQLCVYRDIVSPLRKGGGTPLLNQWLRTCSSNAGGSSSIPGQGTRSHMPQLRVDMTQLKLLHALTERSHMTQLKVKILCATTKTWHRQINNNKNKYLEKEGKLYHLL